MTVSYETTNLLNPLSYGRGYPTLKRVASPAAGQGVSILVPGSRVFRLLSAQFTLATSAAVANRHAWLLLLDGDGVEWMRSPTGNAQAASLTQVWQWMLGVSTYYNASGGGGQMPLPDLLIPEGHTIKLTVDAVDVADQVSNVSLFWEEFPIGGQGYAVGVQPAEPAYPQ